MPETPTRDWDEIMTAIKYFTSSPEDKNLDHENVRINLGKWRIAIEDGTKTLTTRHSSKSPSVELSPIQEVTITKLCRANALEPDFVSFHTARQAMPVKTEELEATQWQSDLQQRCLKAEAEAAAIRATINMTRRRADHYRPIFVPILNIEKFEPSTAIPASKAPDVVPACAPLVATGLVATEALTNTIEITLSTCGQIAQHLSEVNVKVIGVTPLTTQKRKSSIAPLNCEQIARNLNAGKKVKDCFVEYLADNEGQRVFGRAMFYALTRKFKPEAAHLPTLLRSSAPSPSS